MNFQYQAVGLQNAQASADPEMALWRSLRDGRLPELRERFFAHYFPFARSIANRHYRDRRRGDVELPDLCQLAAAGLLEAIDRYDPDRGVPFRGYATRRITGSILDGVAKMSEVREQMSLRNRVRNERIRSLTVEGADQLPVADALQALIDAAVGLAIGFMLEGTALYLAEDDGALEIQRNAYDSVAWKELAGRMMAEVAGLPDRERLILRHHYLNGLTFEQIGVLLGVGKARVSQIHKAAMSLLRQRLRNRGHFALER
jgi:RNA polymerase sigma factor for flagellar operon FliA